LTVMTFAPGVRERQTCLSMRDFEARLEEVGLYLGIPRRREKRADHTVGSSLHTAGYGR
jgi:hypothetical protein